MNSLSRRLGVVAASAVLVILGCGQTPPSKTVEQPVKAPEADAPKAASGENAVPGVSDKVASPTPAAVSPPAAPVATPPARRAAPGPVRDATAAGPNNFYTSDPQALLKQLSGFLAAAKKVKLPGRMIAIVAPHAGYRFSGPAAGWAYKQLEGEDIETVVLLGGHAGGLTAGAVWPGGVWKTPLGSVAVDAGLARALVGSKDANGNALVADAQPHLAPLMKGRPDHALEVHVPFIQAVLPRARIVPIYFNTANPALAARVGDALARALKGRKAVIVASTDLSHYPDAGTAAVVDTAILKAIMSLDTNRIVASDRRLMATYGSKNLKCTACGLGAVIATVEAAKRLGAKGGRLIAYDHSGNHANKDHSRVVGYGAAAIYGAPAPAASVPRAPASPPRPAAPRVPGRMFTDQEHAMLLSLARKSIELAFEGKEMPKIAGLPPALERKAAAFVTLTNKGRLRGCMGTFARTEPVWNVVIERARTAAFRDPRQGLGNVTKDELPAIDIEISVLSDPGRLDDPLSIELGRDGILLKSADGLKGGTYLPQVGKRFKTTEEFLSHCCSNKAGLPADAWRDPKRVTVFAYTAEVFSEGEQAAKAKPKPRPKRRHLPAGGIPRPSRPAR